MRFCQIWRLQWIDYKVTRCGFHCPTLYVKTYSIQLFFHRKFYSHTTRSKTWCSFDVIETRTRIWLCVIMCIMCDFSQYYAFPLVPRKMSVLCWGHCIWTWIINQWLKHFICNVLFWHYFDRNLCAQAQTYVNYC